MNSIAKGRSVVDHRKDDNLVSATIYCDELEARHDARKARYVVRGYLSTPPITVKVTKRVIRADCVHVTVWVVTVREEAAKKKLLQRHLSPRSGGSQFLDLPDKRSQMMERWK